MTCKKWTVLTLACFFGALLLLGTFVAVIDPLFHYHAPLDGLPYKLEDERYQNDGIVRHFDYDAIITGTSMTENFKTSEFDSLFDAKAVKVPFHGSYFKETDENLRRAFSENPHIRFVVRSLDLSAIISQKDMEPNFDYPAYLYDDLLYNDVQYVLNKEILIKTVELAMERGAMDSFDSYAYWGDYPLYAKEAVLAQYQRQEAVEEQTPFTDADRQTIRDNLEQNVLELVRMHPETEFYLFFPPYSIVYWDGRVLSGSAHMLLQSMKYAAELLLECDNIHLFLFSDNFSLVTDLSNYKDSQHYSPAVNSQMLQWMHDGEYELTRENYQERWSQMEAFYLQYDYDSIFREDS